MADKVPTYFLQFDAAGLAVGGGFTPDGTVPAGATVCTQAQAQQPHAWRLQAGQLAAAPPPAFDAAAAANAKQWALATGGFTVTIAGQALRFPTDTQSQGLMTGKAVRLAQPNAPATVDWQFADGFVTLSAADFMTAAVAIADFVQATFDTLKTVLAGVAAGQVLTLSDVESAAWPADHA